jgi:nifR3 family TIM-barrel protein
MQMVETHPEDRPFAVQIFGSEAQVMADAAQLLVELGVDTIDINMGCPVNRIAGAGAGAGMMCNTDGTMKLVQTVVEAVKIPVSVKMRLGWDSTRLNAPVLAREFERLGVAAITIHGRTRAQGFHGSVSIEGIRAVVEAVERIPIIGNGDVRTPQEALAMRQQTGCQAVAIGRGALLDPWIFQRIDRAIRGENWETDATVDDQIAFLRQHFHLMYAQHADFSCLMFRKFAAWYGARLGVPEDLEDRLRRFESVEEFDTIVDQIAARHGERESTVPTALIKVPNGPIEHW